jgi:hypothetical protein
VQIGNEEYLRPHEAVALVRQLRGCSTGWATGLVEGAAKSGKVRTYEGAVENFPRKPGEPPARKITLVNKADLLYWLDQPEEPATPAPMESPVAERAKEMIARYRQTLTIGANPSKTDAERFARNNRMIGGRTELRVAYDLEFGRRRPGRPNKSAKK